MAIDDAGGLVPVLRQYHLHVFVREDGITVDDRGTRDVGDGASGEEIPNDYFIDTLGGFSRDGHYSCLWVLLVGTPDGYFGCGL